MSIEILTIALFAALILLMLSGLPIGFGLAGVAMIFSLFLWGPPSLLLIIIATYSSMSSFVFIAIPLFIFMANILQKSGIVDALYNSIHLWLGPLRGGLAIATVVICTIMAAMVGIIGAGIVSMGILALPAMLKRNYNKHIAIGAIMAGGGLGVLIPPSVLMMIYAVVTNESVGKLFAGGVFPGLILSGLFITYIGIRCGLNPKLGPPLPPEDRGSLKQKVVTLRSITLPIILMVSVLGSIFAGIATPTEAAAIGAVGAIISAAVYRKLSWTAVKEALYYTLRLYGMILWILIGAKCFSTFYVGMGAVHLIEGLVIGLGISRWWVLILIQLILILMGMVMDDSPIIMIAAPIFTPLVVALGFDPLWFALVFLVNLQISVLTPPYGMALFYMRGVIPEESMGTLYRSIIPFTIMQAIGLAIVMAFPQTILWLPSLMFQR